MRVRVLRQESPTAEPYWESFDYDGPRDTSVAGMLDYLNYHDDIVNADGQPTRRIAWECSCLQGACGACAMVINGMPALACDTFVRDLDCDEVVLAPLTKFPTIRDLATDRTSIQDNLKRGNVFIGEYQPKAGEDFARQYEAAKCLKCGLCLEVCPNYAGPDGRFYGAVLANEAYLLTSSSKDRAKAIAGEYKKHFARGCSKSLACREICPAEIQTLSSIGYMNRK